jgi:uncharacterized RDD family membrane protein YckC
MTRIRLALATLFVAATVTLPAAQVLQTPTPSAAPQAPAAPDTPPTPQDPFDDFDVFSNNRSAVRIGQDFSLGAGNAVRDAVVVLGDATIAGRVDGDLVVVLGNVKLASTAAIGGDFVAVGGNVSAETGTTVRNDLVVVGGSFDAPPGFIAGGEHTIIGGGLVGTWFQDLGPYLARGLLWGRLIVPDLSWVWSIVALFFLLYLAVNLLFDRPVRACAATLEAKPLTTFGVGLLVLLLVGPICLLLAVSVVGIAVIPFVMFALFAGWIVGKVAVARWIGMSVVPEPRPGDATDPDVPAVTPTRAHGARSLVIGFLLITIAYLIPVIGIVTWAIVGVLGIGSAFLAFLSAYRKENPRPVAPAAVPPPLVPPTEPPPPSSNSFAPPPSSSFGSGDAPPAMAYEAVPLPGAGGAAAMPLSTAPPPAMLLAMPKALFRDRLAAFVLDVILLVLAVNILRADPDEMFLPILLLYHIGFWTWKQTTVGGIICQLRIVRADGAPLTFADALVRGLASIFSLAVFFIGALWILRDPDSQAWHDKIAGTYVVKVPRGWPL